MNIPVKVDNKWKTVTSGFVKANGAWKPINTIYAKTNNTWKQIDTSNVKATVSINPLPNITYAYSQIGTLQPSELSKIAALISNNADITDETMAIYYDNDETNIHHLIAIGDRIKIKHSTTDDDLNYCIIGFNHDDLIGLNIYGDTTITNKAGMTLMLDASLISNESSHWPMYSETDFASISPLNWTNSTMRDTLFHEIYLTFPTEWQSIMQPVGKSTEDGNFSNTVEYTQEILFLLSDPERNSTVFSNSCTTDQKIYPYFAHDNYSQLESIDTATWLRNPDASAGEGFFSYLDPGGSYGGGAGATESICISPVFCI